MYVLSQRFRRIDSGRIDSMVHEEWDIIKEKQDAKSDHKLWVNGLIAYRITLGNCNGISVISGRKSTGHI